MTVISGVTDALGNELHEGDLVMIMLDKPFVVGRVVKMSQGGIDLLAPGGKNTKSLGQIQINCPQHLVFRPGTAVGHIIRVTDPAATKLADAIADSALGETQPAKQGPTIVS